MVIVVVFSWYVDLKKKRDKKKKERKIKKNTSLYSTVNPTSFSLQMVGTLQQEKRE